MATNYNLVTLNELNPIPEGKVIGPNDLLYILRLDSDMSSTGTGYADAANKITSEELVEYVIRSTQTGTAMVKDAGTAPDNVLLLEGDPNMEAYGHVNVNTLPKATDTSYGIVKPENPNLLITEENPGEKLLTLNSELQNITRIHNDSEDLNIEVPTFKVNGEVITTINNKLVEVEAAIDETTNKVTINVSISDGNSPVYFLTGLTYDLLAQSGYDIVLNLNTIDTGYFNTHNVPFKVMFIVPENVPNITFIGVDNNFTIACRPGALNFINVNAVSVQTATDVYKKYIFCSTISEIDA